ncbi:MAG: serine/threonine protein kinase [Myxococcales bacterium]|nr:serine/threonine protein kinase [Myxococcales bacterium]
MQAGSTLGNKYRLVERLGEGGMGSVWVAENLAIKGAEVAIKVLHGNFMGDADAVRRFRQEAEAAVKIGHPNIVNVIDFGFDDDKTPYLVMERLKGESLAARLEREGALAPREAVEVMLPVLKALEAAHEHDILHRDLKPENIFLARMGEHTHPKVLDFGVSKFLGDDAERVKMTRTGALIGTPAYMSPEQSLGDSTVDLRSDVWALGVILYELISGALPYEGANYNAMLVRIATGEAVPLESITEGVDPKLVAVIARAMARSRRERFASVRAFRQALERWLRGDDPQVSAPPRAPSGGAGPRPSLDIEGMPTLVDSARTNPKTPTGWRRRWPLVGVSAALVAIAAGIALRASPNAAGIEREAQAAMGASVQAHRLEIAELPPEAHVLLDDRAVMLPTVIREDGDHRVRVDAPGYRPWLTVIARPRTDVTLQYRGEPLAQPVAPAPLLPPAPPVARVMTPRARVHPAPHPQGHRPRAINDMIGTGDPY